MSAAHGDILSVPFKLRANDVVRHIVNVDTRFRDSPNTISQSDCNSLINSQTDCYFSLLTPIRNVIRIRITSVELPNNYFFFTTRRQNVSFRLTYTVGGADYIRDIVIENGNYTADGPDGDSMVAVLNQKFTTFLPAFTLTVVFSIINGSFTFTGTAPFNIDTTFDSKDRQTDYGLGYYLGYSRGIHSSSPLPSGKHSITSDRCAYFSGDNYVFLYLNDYECVRQTTRTYTQNKSNPQEFTAMAKLIMSQPKNYMVFDDYASRHIKEIVFPSPIDLSRLRIKLMDAYGDILDLCSSQYSFSIEVMEVKNLSLYNTIRDSLSLEYT